MNPAHHIIILGAGIVGATLAQGILMRCSRAFVTLIERDPQRLAAIQPRARLHTAPELGAHTPPAKLYFIAAGTPPQDDGACNVAAVVNATRSAIVHSQGRAAIAIKSTVPPGTARRLIEWSGCTIVSNPEFLTETNALRDLLNPARVLIGCDGPLQHADLVPSFWRDTMRITPNRIIQTDTRTAEAAKYAANAMLAARVAHFNELSDWAAGQGANPDDLALAVGADPRIGPIHASSGYAGRCLPKDVGHLLARHASDLPALDAIHTLNQHRLQRHSQA